MANEIPASVTRSVGVAGITLSGPANNVSGDMALLFQKLIPIGTNVEVDFNLIDVDRVSLVSFVATQDCDIYTNAASGGSPDDHLVLKANVPLVWATGDPADALFLTVDVTKFYITNAVALTLNVAVLQDVTPTIS